ncbi:DUF4111 domain-containing protein [Paenibacillus dendritiformis]|uniref:aminoglycoside adenylyltransferase domain-containing protein n=1 Tax=Paenibacillus dendritiformis TaxID=130049 RepID=UPI00143D41DF|nr:aminoglycoside adenylyltransferase domain-containing protein [Paenibacillus dendritiformis]NKI23964.1 DUF4111 domain-containing protein [Paenibacillus dendritiformis]NRF99200.1 DUF4111 domain-containing protein [Paenibacillus dendritiformis]
MVRPQVWPHCDDDIKTFVLTLMERLQGELGARLMGIYLHGSLAMGSYYRPKSDIDLIAVVEDRLEAAKAQAVGLAIAEEGAKSPLIGKPELSVITARTAREIPVPVPYEVHYSAQWHDKIVNREVNYDEERTDSDLLSHLTYVTQRGICLYGLPISGVFGNVAWAHFMEAVRDDLHWILEAEHIAETPYYGVLNVCRVFQLYAEDSRTVHSKDEGGEWGLKHLPPDYHSLIQQALDVYRSAEPVTEERRRTGGKMWDRAKLLAFRDYARAALQDG